MKIEDLQHTGGTLSIINGKKVLLIRNVQYNIDYYMDYMALITEAPNMYAYFLLKDGEQYWVSDSDYVRSFVENENDETTMTIDGLFVIDEPIIPTSNYSFPIGINDMVFGHARMMRTIPEYLQMNSGKFVCEGVYPVKNVFITQDLTGRNMYDVEEERNRVKDICMHMFETDFVLNFIDQIHQNNVFATRYDSLTQENLYYMCRSSMMMRKADIVVFNTSKKNISNEVQVQRTMCELYKYKIIEVPYN